MAGTAALPAIQLPVLQPTTVDGYNEINTQPLWSRLKVAAGAVAGRSRLRFFQTKKNVDAHMTNCEDVSQLPQTQSYKIAAIELVPGAGTSDAAFKALLAAARLVVEVGNKNLEKVNQPAVFFAHTGNLGLNGALVRQGLYTLNPGEEITLEGSQPFNVYLEIDPEGMTVPNGETLDVYVKFRGQSRGRVSMG